MGDRMKNMGSMMNDPQKRNMYFAVVGAVVVTLGAGFWFASKGTNVATQPSGASVTAIPQVDTTPGGSTSAQYNKDLSDDNAKRAQTALQQGTTALPMPVNTGAFGTDSPIDKMDAERIKREKEEAEAAEKARLEAAAVVPVVQPQPVYVQPQPVAPVPVMAAPAPKPKYGPDDAMLVSTLISSWKNKAPASEFDYARQKAEQPTNNVQGQSAVANTQTVNTNNNSMVAAPLAKTGTIFNAVLETAINSDEPSPVLAKIISGPLKGTRLIGQISTVGEKVVIQFSTANIPNYDSSIKLNAVAVDPEKGRTALATSVDNHYIQRYGILLASAFLGGYADAITQKNTEYRDGLWGPVAVPKNDITSKDINRQAIGNVGKELANNARTDVQNLKPTIHVEGGSAIGILLLDDLKTSSQ